MPANQIKHDVKEGKGTTKSLEKKWDKAKDASKKSTGKDDDWALTNFIYQKERDASVQLNAAARLAATVESDAASKEKLPGTRPVAQRIVNAENRFIEFAMGKGFSKEQAEHILKVYRKEKAIKIDAVGGQFTFTHGDFGEKDVMKRALAM
jgi:hypothetical protein